MNAYLNFNENCLEAMNFYKDCLGGELTLQKVSEMPEMAAMMPSHFADKILHSTLVSGDIVIMGSDLNRSTPIEGNTISLCINCDTEEQTRAFFTSLGKNGKVMDELNDMPWGALFGSLVDQYGKTWLFNFDRTPKN